MIGVERLLRGIPEFERFCSVQDLRTLVESLRVESTDLHVEIVGMSANGWPIHHVQGGTGRIKALLVGFPHANEPIGGLTVLGLLSLLREGALSEVGVEWHIVPCIDPDGAILNEGWSQTTFTLRNYLRHFHRQELRDQVECSFPIHHKKLSFDQPVPEAQILMRLLKGIRPDFYYPLHNSTGTGAAWCALTRDIGEPAYRAIRELLGHHGIALQSTAPFGSSLATFGEGMSELFDTAKYYDYLERTTPSPEDLLQTGACSWEYLAHLHPRALSFVTELPYVRHPSDASTLDTRQPMRQLKLRVDADNKFVATVILEEWDKVAGDLDRKSAFYQKTFAGIVAARDTLHEGLPSWPYKTRDILLNPAYGGTLTEGERFNIYLQDRFFVLCHSFEFVRLLKGSTQTAAVMRAIARLEPIFDHALDEIDRHIDIGQFEVLDYRMLAQVQLGCGLIALDSVLESRT
jgi:hypothetical protein